MFAVVIRTMLKTAIAILMTIVMVVTVDSVLIIRKAIAAVTAMVPVAEIGVAIVIVIATDSSRNRNS